LLADRRPEIRLLRDATALARAGTPNIALVVGESGAGKSYLVNSFLVQDPFDGYTAGVVAVAGMSEFVSRSATLQPVRELVEHLTGIAEHAGAAIGTPGTSPALQSVRAKSMKALFEDSRQLIGSLTGTPSPNIIAKQAADIETQRRWYEVAQARASPSHTSLEPDQAAAAVSRIFDAACPLIVVLDDIQWIDMASLNLLLTLPGLLPGRQFLTILVARDDATAIGTAATYESIARLSAKISRVCPLTVIDLSGAIRHRAIDFTTDYLNQLRPAVTSITPERLAELSGGNPLLARDVVAWITGATPSKNGHSSSPEVEWASMPRQLSDLLDARLAGLTPEETVVLESASVQGLEFSANVLADIHEMDYLKVLEMLDNKLGRTHGLVCENPTVVGTRNNSYRFAHGLYREHIYRTRLGVSRRAELHRRVAFALEKTGPPGDVRSTLELARHHESAGDLISAAGYFSAAANRSFELAAFDTALEGARSSLNALSAVESSNPTAVPEETIQMAHRVGAAAARSRGLFEEAAELADRGLRNVRVAADPLTRAVLKSELARSLYNRDREFDRARGLLEEALLEVPSDQNYVRRDVFRQLGIIKQRSFNPEGAIELYLEALSSCSGSGDELLIANLANCVGVSLGLLGGFSESVLAHSHALSWADRAGVKSRDTLFLNDRSASLRRLGSRDDALRDAEAAEALALQQGKAGAAIRAKHERSLVNQGSGNDIQPVLTECFDARTALQGEGPTIIKAGVDLIWLALRQGDLAGASSIRGILAGLPSASGLATGAAMEMHNLLLASAAVRMAAGDSLGALDELDQLAAALPPNHHTVWSVQPLRALAASIGELAGRPSTDERGFATFPSEGALKEALPIVDGLGSQFGSIQLPALRITRVADAVRVFSERFENEIARLCQAALLAGYD
jgi:tetratricopeptide (TPR) repeat protein